MDFSTMTKKMEGHQYHNVDEFEKDFDLMVNNCILYNAKDTTFYRIATKMRDQVGTLWQLALDPEKWLTVLSKNIFDKVENNLRCFDRLLDFINALFFVLKQIAN